MDSNVQIFDYNGNGVTFRKGDSVMVNATEMAKPFGKRPNDYLALASTKELISAITKKNGISENQLVMTIVGSPANGGGTWLHEDVALDFAQWLSIDFKLWCHDRIKELIQVGFTATPATLEAMIANPDLVIGMATQLKQLRAENAEKQRKIEEDAPKVEYHDAVLSSHGFLTVNMIATAIGISDRKLNKLLCEWGVQYKESGCYHLYAPYRGKGYAKQIPYPYRDSMNQIKTKQHLYWTEVGKKFIIEMYEKKSA